MCACTTHLEKNFTPINKNVSLNDPSIIHSGQTWSWANFLKIPCGYSLSQVPKLMFSKMHVGFHISTCLHYLEMVMNIQYGNPKPLSVHDTITKQTPPISPDLLNTFLHYLQQPFFFQRTKKAFCFQRQDSNKKNNKKKREGEKRKLLFCASGGHALVKSLLMSPDYFFLTHCLIIFPLSLRGSLSSFYSP